jgi:hypothetical protein
VSILYLGCYLALLNRTLTLPAITNPTLKKHMYYSLTPNCMRLDACADITIKAIDYTKALKAYVELDPCHFILYAGFEKWERQFILISYEWGKYSQI